MKDQEAYEFTEYEGDTYPLPDEYLSCPGCGKHYRDCTKVCTYCEECIDCHLDGSKTHSDFVSGEEMINRILEQGV